MGFVECGHCGRYWKLEDLDTHPCRTASVAAVAMAVPPAAPSVSLHLPPPAVFAAPVQPVALATLPRFDVSPANPTLAADDSSNTVNLFYSALFQKKYGFCDPRVYSPTQDLSVLSDTSFYRHPCPISPFFFLSNDMVKNRDKTKFPQTDAYHMHHAQCLLRNDSIMPHLADDPAVVSALRKDLKDFRESVHSHYWALCDNHLLRAMRYGQFRHEGTQAAFNRTSEIQSYVKNAATNGCSDTFVQRFKALVNNDVMDKGKENREAVSMSAMTRFGFVIAPKFYDYEGCNCFRMQINDTYSSWKSKYLKSFNDYKTVKDVRSTMASQFLCNGLVGAQQIHDPPNKGVSLSSHQPSLSCPAPVRNWFHTVGQDASRVTNLRPTLQATPLASLADARPRNWSNPRVSTHVTSTGGNTNLGFLGNPGIPEANDLDGDETLLPDDALFNDALDVLEKPSRTVTEMLIRDDDLGSNYLRNSQTSETDCTTPNLRLDAGMTSTSGRSGGVLADRAVNVRYPPADQGVRNSSILHVPGPLSVPNGKCTHPALCPDHVTAPNISNQDNAPNASPPPDCAAEPEKTRNPADAALIPANTTELASTITDGTLVNISAEVQLALESAPLPTSELAVGSVAKSPCSESSVTADITKVDTDQVATTYPEGPVATSVRVGIPAHDGKCTHFTTADPSLLVSSKRNHPTRKADKVKQPTPPKTLLQDQPVPARGAPALAQKVLSNRGRKPNKTTSVSLAKDHKSALARVVVPRVNDEKKGGVVSKIDVFLRHPGENPGIDFRFKDGCVMVGSIRHGTPAARSELLVNMIVDSINGKKIVELADATNVQPSNLHLVFMVETPPNVKKRMIESKQDLPLPAIGCQVHPEVSVDDFEGATMAYLKHYIKDSDFLSQAVCLGGCGVAAAALKTGAKAALNGHVYRSCKRCFLEYSDMSTVDKSRVGFICIACCAVHDNDKGSQRRQRKPKTLD
jgi:hypothetical protein